DKPPISYIVTNDTVYPADTIGSDNYPIVYNPTYELETGPLDVKVVDPLNVRNGSYTLKFTDVKQPYYIKFPEGDTILTDSLSISNAKWRLSDGLGNFWNSDTTINVRNEQIIPELGIAITIEKTNNPGDSLIPNNGLISSSLHFADSSEFWFFGIPDNDVPASPLNWIRSGVYKDDAAPNFNDWDMTAENPWDPGQDYEKILIGTWAPYCMTATGTQVFTGPAYSNITKSNSRLKSISSIDFVVTADRTKWTRCPVVEMSNDESLAEGGAPKYSNRRAPSIDKDGNFADPGAEASDDPESPSYISPTGMGWFPGYAINIETGERMNIMYGENSWLSGDNGRDMKWNPSYRVFDDQGNAVFGGMHYVYVMNNVNLTYSNNTFRFPAYDAGRYLHDTLVGVPPPSTPLPRVVRYTALYSSCMWVNLPFRIYDSIWLPENNPATVKIRISKPYRRYFSTAMERDNPKIENKGYPSYAFNIEGYAPVEYSAAKNQSDLDLINVVPNPYYAYADAPGYERNQLDTRVKVINLPEKCVVTIYNISGTFIRQYNVDKAGVPNPSASTNGVDANTRTSIDWDLKNFAGIPIAGGIYLIHVKETGGRYGERVIKWFGSMRPIDLNTF
nr:hypothetical protein [Bacteroidota bacterium]